MVMNDNSGIEEEFMKILQRIAAASLIAGGMLVSTALAQEPSKEMSELELDYLLEQGTVEAEIIEMNTEVRTLTVQMGDVTANLIVPENAEIVRTFPNDLEREIQLSDLRVGDDIMIEGYEVDGLIQLRIIGVIV
jgi:hypothetical protein